MTPSPYAPPKSGKSDPLDPGEVGVVVLFLQIVIFAACLNFHAPIWIYLLLTVSEFVVRLPVVLLLSDVPREVDTAEAFNAADHPNGKELWEYLRDVTVALHAEGFFLLDPVLQSSGTGPKTCLASYRNEAGEGVVVVTSSVLPGHSSGSICVVETSFTEGSSRQTCTWDLANLVAPLPGVRSLSFPQVEDPVRLVRIHGALVKSRERGVIAPILDKPRESIAQGSARLVDHWVNSGALVPGKGENLRYTVSGAVRAAWAISPPVIEVRRLLDRWKAARILKELNLAGADPAPIRLKGASSGSTTLKIATTWVVMTAIYGLVLLHPPQIGRTNDRVLLQRVTGGR